MKIVEVIARDNRGGTARWLQHLVTGLRERGHDVSLLAGKVQANESEDPSFEALHGIRIPGLGRRISILADLQALLFLRKYFKMNRPDIVNTHTAKAGVIGRLAVISMFSHRPKIVHTFHGHLLHGYFSAPITKAVVIVERLLALNTDLLFAAGDKVKEDLISVGIGNQKKFRVLRPGVANFTLSSRIKVRSQLGINENIVVVGGLGRLTTIKRPDRVLEIARRFPNQLFLIGGEGELKIGLESAAPANVRFLGWTSPDIIWSISDIALLTSENEAQPISLIEASFAGLPIVAQDVGSVGEVVIDKKTGFLANNLDEYIEKIKLLIEDRRIRIETGVQGSEFCRLRFGIEQFIDGHETAYFDVFQS